MFSVVFSCYIRLDLLDSFPSDVREDGAEGFFLHKNQKYVVEHTILFGYICKSIYFCNTDKDNK